ncbi:MAG TPA: M20 family metallo-hydrolase, partial [Chloroflexota bacterium]
MTNVRVEPAEMQYLVETLGAIGEQPGGGIIRPVYSAAWVAAREQLATWMREAGLTVRGDAVGNLFGRMTGPSARTLLTGSHFDTVKLGGRYDGALGVLAALAALRALQAEGFKPRKCVEMVALCEEEGSRFHSNFWGTRGILGQISSEELTALADDDGVRIGEAMRSVGLPPEDYRQAVRDDIDAFVELHIEQGRILHDAGVPLGVVQTITGLYRFLATVEGRTDHAGTTPMDLRRDAFQAAAEIALEMTRIVSAEGRPAVVTTGYWDVQPGAWNIVPGLVRFGVDLRHPDEAVKQQLGAAIRVAGERVAAERGLTVHYEMVGDVAPNDMHPSVRAAITGAAEALGVRYIDMVSGAGHDSQVMATRVPTGMLFVPSVDGRSHSAAEFTSS